MLPDSYRWHDGPEGSRLFYNYGCVATVRAGRVSIGRGRKRAPLPPLEGVCGSVEQGKRHVERWVMARMGRLTRN
ncbi:hypothetical protein CSC62_05510 [Pseudoxanthomonas jiangsuensis]|nr:hypothetical protein CSC62_05510 [Pseudoxanthomonas jiangsuensis]